MTHQYHVNLLISRESVNVILGLLPITGIEEEKILINSFYKNYEVLI